MPIRTLRSTLVLAALTLAACGPAGGTGERDEVMVFAAASLRDALEEIGAAFEAETGARVLFNFAGSGDLARQILATSQADLYLSAAEDWVDTLERAGRVEHGARVNLLGNRLVIIRGGAGGHRLPDACALANLSFDDLAMGDPESVPAGRYARAWLESVPCDGGTLWSRVSERVAPAHDVRAVVGQVLADRDIVGIVYRTDWLACRDRVSVLLEIADGPPIHYVLARLSDAPNADGADAFRQFLVGTYSRDVFRRHGFIDVGHDTISNR